MKLAILSGVFCFLYSPVWAQFWDFFAPSARHGALAGGGSSVSQDASAAYYNPAGLVDVKGVESLFHLSFVHFGAVQVSVEKSKEAASQAENLEDLLGVTLGIALVLGGGRKKIFPTLPCGNCGAPVPGDKTECPRCGVELEPLSPQYVEEKPWGGLGVLLLLPFKDITEAEAFDPSTPRVLFYSSQLRRLGFVVSAGFRPWAWLSVGAGISILADARVVTKINQPLTGPVNVDFKETLRGDVAPVFGLRWKVFPNLGLSLTYRGELSLKVDAIATTVVGGVTFFYLRLESITLFSPHQLTLSLFYRYRKLLFTLDLTWYNWSRWKTTANFVENQPGSLPLTTESPPSMGSRDVWVPRFGVEYEWGKWHFRGGYAFYPAIVKEQKGVTNILDSDRHILSLGVGRKWGFGKWKGQVSGFFLLHLLGRKNRKVDPTDPYGTTKLEGLVLAFGLSWKTEF